MVQPLSDDDRDWLKALDDKIWPETPGGGDFITLKAARPLKEDELTRLTRLLNEGNLVVEMFSTSMFGGYGVRLYEHEPYPHAGPVHLVSVIEGHIPPPSRYDREVPSKKSSKVDKDKIPGSGSTRAWKYFSKYTHTPKMTAYCAQYRLKKPQERNHYDY